MPPLYDYKALSADGKPAKGIVEAESQKAARTKLKKQGLMVTGITEKNSTQRSSTSSVPFFGGRVSGAEIAAMTRQLASLIKANIPLVEALTAMVDQTENERLKVILSQVRQDVNEGSSFAKALATHPKVFDSIFVNMIEAGESSGTLGLVLLRLADLKEAQMRLRSKVIGGMTYPALMMGVAFVLMLGIFTFVIPQMQKIFTSMNKKMPPITALLMSLSEFIVSYWYLIALSVGLFLFFFLKFIRSAGGKPKWDAFKLTLPIMGPLIRLIAVTRFANTLGTLLSSNVPILAAMNIAKNLVGNVPIERAITDARENITEGQSIADPLRKSGQFPPMMIHMIAIGEKTGELPAMLKNIADTYEEQVNTKIDAMTSLLEPLMIIMMGGAVAVIVLAVFVPLLDISNINQR
ncbi:MAG: type II secretion system inner membrane protein GspF [Oligoflexia bacterium]|nr:type II secretion system inner membrane protein GspF [Oligoflexia bacterium]